jgi:zinc transport system substrate-binding protein
VTGKANADEELDEHVWTSPRNAKLIVSDIAKKLSQIDPAGQEYYEANLASYLLELDALDNAFGELVNEAKRKTIVLGDRFPMRYFTMEYGLAYYAAFPGCSAQTEPSARTLAFLMDKIKEEKIPVVFYIEFSSGKSAGVIAEETGAKPLLLHSAHNVTLQEMQNGASYLSLMRGNLETLREALN